MKRVAFVIPFFIAACGGVPQPVSPIAPARNATPTIPLAVLQNAQSTAIADATRIAATASALQLHEIVQSSGATHVARLQELQLTALHAQRVQGDEIARMQVAIAGATLTAMPTTAKATAESASATQAAIFNGLELEAQRHRERLRDEAFYGELQRLVLSGFFALLFLASLVSVGWGAVRTIGAWHKLQAEAQAAIMVAEAQAKVAEAQAQYMAELRNQRAISGQITPAPPTAASDEVVTFVKAAIAADTALNGNGTRIPPASKMGSHWAGGNWQRAVDALAKRGLIYKVSDAPNAGWQVAGGNLHQLLIDVGG